MIVTIRSPSQLTVFTQASAFADIGFTTFVLGRVDDQDRSWRKTAKELEFIWRPSKSLGPGNQILGAITPEGYCMAASLLG